MPARPAESLPRPLLLGAGLLIAFALVTAATARLTGIGTTTMPPSAPVEVRELRFLDRSDGAVEVRDAGGAIVAVLAPGSHGFVRGALRGLARERRLHALAAGAPFRLTRWADGRLTVEDPETGRAIDLGAFGPANYGAFARLMTVTEERP